LEKTLDPWVAWRLLGDEECARAHASLADRAPQVLAGSAIASAQCSDLSFYDDHLLIELRFDSSRGLERVFGLHGPDQTHWLDGTSAPVHEANEADSLALTAATVHDYIRFFLYFVRGDDGAFALIESESELALADGDVSAGHNGGSPEVDVSELQARLANARSHARPLTAPVVGDDGRWVVEGTVAYGGGLFESTFAVDADGQIEMLDDNPVELLGGIATPEFPSLELDPIPSASLEPDGDTDVSDLVERMARANLIDPQSEEIPRDRDITEAIVAVLLEDAFREVDSGEAGSSMLVRHFNPQAAGDTPIALLSRLVAGSLPVIVIESDIPFVEDFVAGLVDGPGQSVTGGAIARAGSSDERRCYVDLSGTGAKLHLLSFHVYRGLADAERTSHELAIRDCAVLIGCSRLADVPEPLRRIQDLVLTFPPIDRHRFEQIFERVFAVKPTPGWDAPGADWTRYLVPADFHLPRRLRKNPDEALLFLRDRVERRLAALTPEAGRTLDKLYGLGEARQVCEDIVTDIQAAQAGRIPWSAVDKGMLMVGPPGTGKTSVARALAKACGIKFIATTAAKWQSSGHLAEHLSAMRADFDEARRYAPAILFIDEIDSIGSRERLGGDFNAVYQTDVINALLAEIQGFETDEPVVVIGATNYPDNVDPALRRSGRLDQLIRFPLPNITALEEMFGDYLEPHKKAKQVARGVDLRTLAELTWGGTGADVEFFVRGAARRARRAGRKIKQEDLLAEVTRLPRRPDSAPRLGKGELRRTAVHEAGHAVARLLSSTQGEDVTFITIVPRLDGSLGFVATAPREGHQHTRRTLLEQLETVLAGRAAEELVYGEDDIGAGAGGPSERSDLAAATRLAELIVCQSGLGADDALHWTSEPTPAQVKQIGAMLAKSYRSVLERLEANRDLLDRVADILEDKQELSGAELRSLLAKAKDAPPLVT
jgi:ATP-dependent Zn protease